MFSFERLYGINKSQKIALEEINTFKDDKLFVTVGGIGAEKSFITRKFVALPILDVDDYVTKVGGGTYDRSNLGEGRKIFNASIDRALEGNKSFVHIGTNTNLNETKKRLKKAKENGFTNVLVLIDTNPEIAYEQVNKRVDEQEILMERIIQFHDDAFEVFNSLKKDNDLVDFYVYKLDEK